MRRYYVFKINDSFCDVYKRKPFYLYKILNEIHNSSNDDLKAQYRVYKKIIKENNKNNINGIIYKKNHNNVYYYKELNKHVLKDAVENTIMKVYNTYITVDTNKNVFSFMYDLKTINNLFICDFDNKDYFWLNELNNNLYKIKNNSKIVV